MNARSKTPRMIVAIDGPAGSGKSTAARMLAEAEGFAHLNTGAMYRAVTYLVDEGAIDADDTANAERLVRIAESMAFDYEVTPGGEQRFQVAARPGAKKKDLTDALFTAALTLKLKPVVNNEGVRAALVEKMRQAAFRVLDGGAPGVVLEGRDIGTVVFPDAFIKFFVSADLDTRTMRRASELNQRGEVFDLKGLREQIAYRDKVDESRTIGPLRMADDAIYIDTSHLDPTEALKTLQDNLTQRRAEA